MPRGGSKNGRTRPPDGGWGWIVVLGVGLVNLATRSSEPSFGLLFGDLLNSLSIHTTGAGIIVSTYEAVFNFSGLFVGPLIKTYSHRKVALFGAVLAGLGLIATFPAASMTHILCTYSIINGLGVGFSASATFVALNHYFKKKRGLAVGLTMTGTGVGFLLMPQAIRYLTEEYDFAGSMLIVGAIALNACVGATVLQPVKWHLRKTEDEEGKLLKTEEKEENGNFPHITITHVITEKDEEAEEDEKVIEYNNTAENSKENVTTIEKDKAPIIHRKWSVIMRHHSLFDTGDTGQKNAGDSDSLKEIRLLNKSSTETKLDKYFEENRQKPVGRRKFSEIAYSSTKTVPSRVTSNNSINKVVEPNLGISTAVTTRKRKGSTLSNLSNMDFTGSCLHIHAIQHEVHEVQDNIQGTKTVLKAPEQKEQSVWSRFAHLMDLDLLKDPIFLNILFGLSIFYVAELNFKMIVPFYLADLGHSKSETAFCLTMMAASDIVARIILPPICDRLMGVITRRTMFMVAAIFCAGSRSGATLINFMLVVSEYCDEQLEKLPAAFGLHMVAKGIFIALFGPLIAFIRDATDSYPICVHAQSICILLCVIAWTAEKLLRCSKLSPQPTKPT